MDDLLLAVFDPDDPNSDPTVIRVRVPDDLTATDLYLKVLAEVPAGQPQPVALNIGRSPVSNRS